MFFLERLKGLRGRLISAALLIGLIPMLVMLGISYQVSKTKMQDEAEQKLTVLKELKKNQIVQYFDIITQHIITLAVNNSTQQAILDFGKAWKIIAKTQSPKVYLQDKYIINNPNPVGQKDKLYDAKDGSEYSNYHKLYHVFFHKTQQEFAYYDIFLFDLDGNLLYTVFKEYDYASNLKNGTFSNSGLGEVFQKGIALKEGESVLIDFKPYAPSNGDPASFISSPIYQNGVKIGLIAFQMPLGKINEIMRNRAGHGQTGESILVGKDGYMRSDSWRDSLNFSVSASFAKKNSAAFLTNPIFNWALKNNSGVSEGISYLNEQVVVAYEKVKFHDLEWILLSQITTAEAFEALMTMRNRILLSGLILLLLTFAAAYFISISTENPIRYSVEKLNQSMAQFEVLSHQIAESSDQIATGASQQASAIEETSASISEIASSATVNAEASSQADELASELNETARLGQNDLKSLQETMQMMKKGADKSSMIIKTIDEIAFQTHLLALNAAVEAARAGAMGASFAVVADEVRSLAKKVTEAARETEDIISQSIRTAQEGNKRLVDYEKRFATISIAAHKISQITQTIKQSASDQSHATNQISLGIQETEKVVQHNAASAEEFSAASHDMNVEVSHLQNAVVVLNVLITGSQKNA